MKLQDAGPRPKASSDDRCFPVCFLRRQWVTGYELPNHDAQPMRSQSRRLVLPLYFTFWPVEGEILFMSWQISSRRAAVASILSLSFNELPTLTASDITVAVDSSVVGEI